MKSFLKVILFYRNLIMAEKPEDLNLPNAVISRLAKEAVRHFLWSIKTPM